MHLNHLAQFQAHVQHSINGKDIILCKRSSSYMFLTPSPSLPPPYMFLSGKLFVPLSQNYKQFLLFKYVIWPGLVLTHSLSLLDKEHFCKFLGNTKLKKAVNLINIYNIYYIYTMCVYICVCACVCVCVQSQPQLLKQSS